MHGWIILDKPLGLGSTQGVSAVKRVLRQGGYGKGIKVGHGGTLDPLATGVLPIAVGEATKLAGRMLDSDKVYDFTIRFGVQTSTLDAEGEVVAESNVRPTREALEAVLPRFTGPIDQVPPAYSALKIDGERAYDLARDGVEFELPTRKVTIFDLKVVEQPDPDHITLEMECGKGTYVRAVVRDLAKALGACGHVADLRRTRVGGFSEAGAISLETLENLSYEARLSEALLPVETALDDIPALAVTDEDAFRLAQGRAIVLLPRQVETLKAELPPGDRTVSAMSGDRLVALCEMRAGRLNPVRVFQLT